MIDVFIMSISYIIFSSNALLIVSSTGMRLILMLAFDFFIKSLVKNT